MLGKIVPHFLQGAGQVLLVAVEPGQDVSGRAVKSSIDRIVHPLVLFDECLDPRLVAQPIRRAVVRAGVLHDVLELDPLLVGNRRDTELEPLQTTKTGRDDRELRRAGLLARPHSFGVGLRWPIGNCACHSITSYPPQRLPGKDFLPSRQPRYLSNYPQLILSSIHYPLSTILYALSTIRSEERRV